MRVLTVFTLLLLACVAHSYELDVFQSSELKDKTLYYQVANDSTLKKTWTNFNEVKMQKGASEIAQLKFINRMKQTKDKPIILDCSATTCTQKIQYTASENEKISLDSFSGIDGLGDNARLKDKYFLVDKNFTVYNPVYKSTCQELFNLKNATYYDKCTYELVSNKSTIITKQIKTTDTQYIEKGESVEVRLTFTRNDFRVDSDLVPIVHGTPINEMAMWKGYIVTKVQKLDNPEMTFGRSNITGNLTNYPVRIQMNTTNSSLFNHSINSTNILFLNASYADADTSNILNFIYVNASNSINTTFYVASPNVNMSSPIWAFVLAQDAGSQANDTGFCSDVNAMRWYDLEETSGTIYDRCGNVNSDAQTGITYTEQSIIQDGIEFSGAGYVDVDSTTGITIDKDKYYLFSTWIRPDTAGTTLDFFAHCTGTCMGGTYDYLIFRRNSANKILMGTYDGLTGFGGIEYTSPSAYSSPQWLQTTLYHSAPSFTDQEMYINGSSVASGGSGSQNSDFTFYPSIGAMAKGTGTIDSHSFYFDGLYDSIRIFEFDSALSDRDEFAKGLDALVYTFGNDWETPLNSINVTLNSPSDNTNYSSNTTQITFNWTCFGGNASYTANLSISGKVNQSNIPVTNNTPTTTTVNFNETGDYTWSIICANNTEIGISDTYTFTITPAPNITTYLQTTNTFNSTIVNYSFTPMIYNPTASSQELNFTLEYQNGTDINTSNSQTLTSLGLYTFLGHSELLRQTNDTSLNITLRAINASNSLSIYENEWSLILPNNGSGGGGLVSCISVIGSGCAVSIEDECAIID